MSDSYKVKVNDSFQFDIEKKTVLELDSILVGRNKFHILQDNFPFTAEILISDFRQKKYSVRVNNNIYAVSISNDLDVLIQELGFENSLSKEINFVKAPMPGLIMEINVATGQSVKENDTLIILGAMKMENSFLSPREGVIKSISVTIGQTIEKGQLLIEFE
jgi:biotin carboxyl carrier protein